MKPDRLIISAIVALLFTPMIIFSGCHQEGASAGSKDSTEILRIDEMQYRGSDYRNCSDFVRAIATHDSCIRMAEAIHDTIQLVIALNNQGTNYRRLSANKEAADYHFRALQLCDAYSDTTTFLAKKNRVRSLNGLGNIMMSMGNYTAAEQSFRSALAGEANLHSATGQAINLANIGSIKVHGGDMDSARIYYNLSMEKNREDNNQVGICLCYTYFGELDQKAGHLTDALNNYRQAFAVGLSTGDVWHWLTPCLSLAQIFTDQNQPDSAYKYINIGVEAAEKIHSNEHLRDFYGVRSLVEERQGKVSNALADLRLSTVYKDSVDNEEARNSVQNARANYEISRRNIEVKAANEEAESSRFVRNLVIITAIFCIFFLLFAFWQYRRSVRLRHKAEHEREIFVRNIAHQLRTPMTVVTGLVEQLKGHIPADDTVGRESLEATQRQSRKLQELVLELAHMPKDEMDPLLNEHGDIAKNTLPSTPVAPKTPTTTEHNAVFSAPADATDSDKPSILLAEDTDDVAMMMCGLLRDHGYAVTRAADGQEALELLQHELPDLLITDIAMPRMDGLELMRRVRDDDTMCHLPIIVASARVEDSERMEGISAGAEVYLTKPFIPEELLLRVSTMLKQRERLRRIFSHAAVDKEEKVEAPQMNQEEKEFMDKLDKVIDDNLLSGDVNVNFIADKMFSSVSTVTRKIKNITGMPAATYIRSRRMILAKQLLSTTDKPISEIEILCGFNTPGHFSRFFKSETGLSPSEYRQQQAS